MWIISENFIRKKILIFTLQIWQFSNFRIIVYEWKRNDFFCLIRGKDSWKYEIKWVMFTLLRVFIKASNLRLISIWKFYK